MSSIADAIEQVADSLEEEVEIVAGPSKRRRMSEASVGSSFLQHPAAAASQLDTVGDSNGGRHADYSFFSEITLPPVPFQRAVKARQNVVKRAIVDEQNVEEVAPCPNVESEEVCDNWQIRVKKADGTWGVATGLHDPKRLFVDKLPQPASKSNVLVYFKYPARNPLF